MKKVSGIISWNELTLTYVGISDAGQVRENNEDDFLIMPEYRLFCVADGMGGHFAGEIASRLTLESIANFMDSINPAADTCLSLEQSPPLFSAAALTGSINYANTMVLAEAAGKMMGSTIVAGQIIENSWLLAHAGDSRIYRYADGHLQQLTEDHSYVNDLYLNGQISKQEMRTHPQRNIITRAVGTSSHLDVAIQSSGLEKDTILLFCSDGLTGMLEDRDIAEILAAGDELNRAGESLVARANAAGGRDNITILLVAIQ